MPTPAESDAPGACSAEVSLLPRLQEEPYESRLKKLASLPFVEYALDWFKEREQQWINRLRKRLAPEPPVLFLPPALPAPCTETGSIQTTLNGLLDASRTQTRVEAEHQYFRKIAEQLVPDQALMLSALADQSTYPLLGVEAISFFGTSEVILTGVSNLGRSAGAKAPGLFHVYLNELIRIGLAEVDPVELPEGLKYEILESDPLIREAVERLKSAGIRGRIRRKSIRISSFGLQFWQAMGNQQPD